MSFFRGTAFAALVVAPFWLLLAGAVVLALARTG